MVLKIISFNGKRDDYNTAKQLKDGKEMITPPRERLIHNAIKKLSTYSSNRNVENLLGIASANQYGIRQNSALRQYLNENSPLSGTILENNPWDIELQKATEKAIKKLAKNKREKFLQKYNEIFIQPQELTRIEKKIIKYRESIINSKPMQEALSNKSKQNETSKALKFLDYFVASSETPMKEKAYVLLKLSHLMSDAYSIHPQLKDKKFQIFSEIINDLVIKIPSQDEFTSKDCSQEKHGSCAATSVARKALLYEDKVAYINTLLSELDDKTYMEIYDVTRLLEYQKDEEKYEKLRAPKVKVEKAQINYDRAIFEGYRIIDAAALNWMKIAGTVGDGTLSLQDYVAFDARHNGLFFDSRILKIDDDDYATRHAYLKTMIKSQELLKSYEKNKRKEKILNTQNTQDTARVQINYATKKKNFIKNIKEIEPAITNEQIHTVLNKTLDLLNINPNNNDEILANQLATLLKKQLGADYSQKIKKNPEILKALKEYIKAEKENNDITLSPLQKYSHAKTIFQIGLAQREFLLTQLEIPNMDKNLYYDEYQLPNYPTQVQQHIKKLIKLAKTKPQSPIILELQKEHNINNKELQEFLSNLYTDATENILEEIDKKLAVYHTSYKEIIIKGLRTRIAEHKDGNYDFMFAISDKTKTIPDSKKFEKMIIQMISNVKKAKSYQEIENAIRPLGAQSPYETIHDVIENFVKSIDNAIVNKGFESLNINLNTDKKFKTEEEFLNIINTNNEEISKLLNLIYQIADATNFPDEAELIIKLNEKRKEVLTENEISILKKKFDEIEQERRRISNLREQGIDAKINNNIFIFNKEEKELLDKIEKQIPTFSRVVDREYRIENKIMSEKLDELYSALGKRTGHFWVREEGSSGLYNNESVRIFEQMTGRPYHVESDFDEVIKHIQSGKGSGTSGTNVCWDDIGGHAQYIADVRTIKIKDPKTGKIEEKTVMLHDNTWGHAEKRSNWIDQTEVGKTDYDRKFGPKGGFILSPEMLTGTTSDIFKYDVATDSNEVFKKAINGPETEVEEEYSCPIFWHAELPGLDTKMNTKLDKIIEYILNLYDPQATVNEIFNILNKPGNKLNVDFLNKFDELINTKQEQILEKIVKDEKPRITIEQYNKLDKNDELKIIIEKLILTKAFPDIIKEDIINTEFGNIRTHEALEKFKQKKLEEYKNFFREILYKKEDKKGEKAVREEVQKEINHIIDAIEKEKNIKLKSLKTDIQTAIEKAYEKDNHGNLDDLLDNIAQGVEQAIKNNEDYKKISKKDSGVLILASLDATEDNFMLDEIKTYKDDEKMQKYFIFLDKKFDNIDDEDLMKTHRTLMSWDKEEFEELIKDMTFDDLDIKFDTPENVIKLIQAGSSLEQKRLDKVTLEHYYDEIMAPAKKTASTTANTAYRNFHVDLVNMLDDKFINKYKNIYFKQYKVRPAIPKLEVKSKRELVQMLKPNIDNLQLSLIELMGLTKGKNCTYILDKLTDLIKYENINEQRDEIIYNLNSLLNEIKTDSNCNNVANVANTMKNRIERNNFTKEQIETDFHLLSTELRKITGNATLETIKAEFIAAKTTLTKNIDFIVRTNVLPQYQSSVRRALYNWVTEASKDKIDYQKTKEALNAASVNLLSHHVFTNPAELFTYTVKLSQQKPKAGDEEMHEAVLNKLKMFVADCYQKVNRTKLEYKLMSLASKGNASKIRDYLNNNVKMKNKRTFIEADGMKLVRMALEDPSNNNSSLLLFVEQAGLIDDLLNSIYKDELKNEKKFIKKLGTETTRFLYARSFIKEFFNEFLKQNQDIKNPTKEDLMKALDKYLEELLKTNVDKRYARYVDEYWNMFSEATKNFEIPPHATLNVILATIQQSTTSYFNNNLQHAENEMTKVIDDLNSDINLLNSMKLLDNGTDEGKREEHIEKIYKVISYATNCSNFLAALNDAYYAN